MSAFPLKPTELVEWVDHLSSLGGVEWYDQEEWRHRHEASVVIRSVGMVLFEDEERVQLAMDERIDADLSVPLYKSIRVIMKALILRRIKLQAVEEEPA